MRNVAITVGDSTRHSEAFGNRGSFSSQSQGPKWLPGVTDRPILFCWLGKHQWNFTVITFMAEQTSLLPSFNNRKQEQITSADAWRRCWFGCFVITETAPLPPLLRTQSADSPQPDRAAPVVSTRSRWKAALRPAMAHNALDDQSKTTQPC